MKSKAENAEAKLLKAAGQYPGAYEDFPWGERVMKVNKKIFVFLGLVENGLRVSLKLPDSAGAALGLPFVERTGYNLG
ncbi:MAG: MmcQ/YjbR family DNA-binding protein, partial [Candidatus Eremiobacteraeota bacterium]|nr:MmcQ/YjbR family DNA-binding protein [Candidatus Eremiobacteraeota bacterium]